jgi:hypothetical protein
MWKVYCDDELIFHNQIESLRIYNPKLDLELNKTGAFTFTIYPSHPSFDRIERLKSIIKIYNNDYLIYKGRVLEETSSTYNDKTIICEGELAFFIDSIQRYTTETLDIGEFFNRLINSHNSQVEANKRFKKGNIAQIGDITIEDANYCSTWEALTKEIIEKHGGYLWVRNEEDGDYLDYLTDFTILSNQSIEFGKNLLQYSKQVKGADIITAIIPIGKDKTTIASINNDIDYLVNEEAIKKYGWICKAVEFKDVEDKTELKRLGQEYLSKASNLIVSLEIGAIDLAGLEKDINNFRLGTYVKVVSNPHNLNENFLVNKLSIDLLKPSNNKLSLGKSYETFTEKNYSSNQTQQAILKSVQNVMTKEVLDEAIKETNELTSSSLTQNASEIISKVSQEFILKAEKDEIISSINTSLEQTKDSFEFRFNQFNQEINDVVNDTDAQFQEIKKYIRFVNGSIELGDMANPLTLKLKNDRISFYNKNNEVAFFSENKLFVTNGEFINTLKLGKFAFLPRTNGNVSFKKIE